MNPTNRLNETTIRNIVNRVVNKLLEEGINYDSYMSLEELKRALIGKKLSMYIMDMKGDREFKLDFEGEIYKIEDITNNVLEELYDTTEGPYYGVSFYRGLWGFTAKELTTLATRRRLYKDAYDEEYEAGYKDIPDSENERWLFEIN